MRAAISPGDGLRPAGAFAAAAAAAAFVDLPFVLSGLPASLSCLATTALSSFAPVLAGFAAGGAALVVLPATPGLDAVLDLGAGGRAPLLAGTLAAGLRDGAGFFAAACFVACFVAAGFFAGVFLPAGFREADLPLPAAGVLRKGFACFLTMIILVRYGAAGWAHGWCAIPSSKVTPFQTSGGGAKNLKL